MSFDIPPLHIADDSLEAQVIETIIKRDHVTPEEAIRTALRGMAIRRSTSKTTTAKRLVEAPFPLTDEELANLDKLCPALKLLDEVTDEDWDSVIKGARKMNEEGFARRV